MNAGMMLPPQVLAALSQGAVAAPQGMPQVQPPPMPPQQTSPVGGAIAEPSVALPKDPKELEARKSGWAKFLDMSQNDENFGRALIAFGARALMNDPRMGSAGNLAAALQQATNLYHGLNAQDQAQAMAQEEKAYDRSMDQKQLDLQSRQVAATEKSVDSQVDSRAAESDRQDQSLTIQGALAEANINLKNAQAEALKADAKDGGARPGAVQLMTEKMADVLLSIDSKKPEDKQEFKGDADLAFKAAHKMLNQRDDLTKEGFIGQMLTRMPPELLAEQADINARAEEGEETPNLVQEYVNYVNQLAETLYKEKKPVEPTTPEAQPSSLAGQKVKAPDGTEVTIIKELDDGRVQIKTADGQILVGPKSALGL